MSTRSTPAEPVGDSAANLDSCPQQKSIFGGDSKVPVLQAMLPAAKTTLPRSLATLDDMASNRTIEEEPQKQIQTEAQDKDETPQMVPTKFHTFAKRSDLTIIVGTVAVAEYKISSRTLTQYSKVFDAMLFGNFSERQPSSGDWVVRLPEDDPDAMEYILGPIHDCNIAFAEIVDWNLADKLAYTIDYYDMYESLRNIGCRLLSFVTKPISFPCISKKQKLQRLHMAWILGQERIVADGLREAVEYIYYDKNLNAVVGYNWDCILKSLKAHGLKDAVWEQRKGIVTKLHKEYLRVLGPIAAENADKTFCKNKDERCNDNSRLLCANAIFGSVLKYFVSQNRLSGVDRGISPHTQFSYEVLSRFKLSECVEYLLGFRVQGLGLIFRDHEVCNPTQKLHDFVKKTSQIPNLLTEEHKAYLKQQRILWGFEKKT